ncbi:serine hydrolase [Nocardioides sp.]|uniref:serine hydrolase domain-containing protein n=1 Tax=Nocardioides sp. TaxID=35761 RepID=UPI00272772D0|nr:serine hydrolase domain-containing protein [Nocardioides sp.]MDO9455908.1 serine hydrolase domain-containing protein [Nocardioides sp.]
MIDDLLAEVCASTDTPGAVVGVSYDGQVSVTAHGVLSRRTGSPVRSDSVFQVGSVTKPFTATLVAQLAAEGRLSLDTTVAELLPGVHLGVDDRSERVTVRHLLTHTSGIDGDLFTDTGRGDDAVARYVDLLADAAVVHEPGAVYSYCNSGFVVLGRIVEVLDDTTWDDALRHRLTEPLGLDDVVTLPEQAILRGAAVGHERGGQVREWALPRSVGPAGTVVTTAADLLGLVRPWLDGSSGGTLAHMADPLVPIPDGSDLGSVGWGWRVGSWGGHQVLGHSGMTLGQSTTLRVVPSLGLAVCVLTNSEQADAVHQLVVPHVVSELTGVLVPPPAGPDPAAAPTGLARHLGTYVRRAARYDVVDDDGALRLTATPTGDLAGHDAVEHHVLVPRDDTGDAFVRRSADTDPWSTVTFGSMPDGTAMLFAQGRVAVAEA